MPAKKLKTMSNVFVRTVAFEAEVASAKNKFVTAAAGEKAGDAAAVSFSVLSMEKG